MARDTKVIVRVRPQEFPKDMIIHKALLVTAAPRSGTRAIASALSTVRFQVGHERSGQRGISSSFFAAYDWYYPGVHRAPLSRYRFDHVWHQTRHPLRTISSIADKMTDQWWHWQEKHTGIAGDMEPIGLRSASFWVNWSKLIEKNHPGAWRYKIEDVRLLWPEMCERLGLPECEYKPNENHGHNAIKDNRHQYSWDELKSLDVDLCDEIHRLADRYGYGES